MGEFTEKFNRGVFKNILRWPQWDAFAEVLRAQSDGQWYAYHVGEAVPAAPLAAEDFRRLVGEIDALLRRDHDEDYLGIVYADDLQQPAMVKVYDPNNLGASCGSSGERILPGWVLSRIPPEDLGATHIVPEGRKRWWRRMFG
ncbi:MAG: hypothetical protein ACOY5C_03140 [Pseudomonadota bacterium]|uniref:hypothetical protein n=1 Tax=Thermithiobacillus tepidarius TaxID=929 RepID=UPI000423C8DD|nr:hypothetical protein [Thermithiobacillus tepidarius]